jgi:hypothetical protein
LGFEQPYAGNSISSRALGLVLALALHALVVVGLAYSISFRLPIEPKMEPKIVALAPQLLPPPPDVERIGPDDVITSQPRFRPREPLTPAQARRRGDPALAIWSYLCNRDSAISEAARRGCPAFDFGEVGLSLLDPLNRMGDVGALFGPDTTTMSLDEVGVARGWMKRSAPTGQGALVGKTDTVDQPAGPELYKTLPSLKHATESAPNLR